MKKRSKKAVAQAQRVRFEFHGVKAQQVFLAGTFNNWQPDATLMEPVGDDQWIKELMLPPGRYEYRFVANGEWFWDPDAAEQVPDGHGGLNSVIEVKPPSEQPPPAAEQGQAR